MGGMTFGTLTTMHGFIFTNSCFC